MVLMYKMNTFFNLSVHLTASRVLETQTIYIAARFFKITRTIAQLC